MKLSLPVGCGEARHTGNVSAPLAIFVYAHLDTAAKELLRSTLPAEGVTFVNKYETAGAHAVYRDRFRASDICFGNVPAEWLEGVSRLRWLQLESTGFEYYLHVRGLPPRWPSLISRGSSTDLRLRLHSLDCSHCIEGSMCS